jgi:hypothetical protein
MMAYREFQDEAGRVWEAWDVQPTLSQLDLTRQALALPFILKEGWLAFRHGTERRRVAPIPLNWAELAEQEMRALLARAEVMHLRRWADRERGGA